MNNQILIKRKTWGFFKILKQILKNDVINIPNDMRFERKATNTCV
jgi:hypothetical protein